jgi:cell division protein FtsN
VNSPSIRISRAVASAVLFLSICFAPGSASLLEHPDTAKSDAPARPQSPPSVNAPAPPPSLPDQPASPPSNRSWQAAHQSGPTDALRETILLLARKGLLDSAYAVSKQALAQDAGNPFLLLMLGKLGPEGKASAGFFLQAIKAGGASPEAEESLYRLGLFHYAAGKYALAIPFFRDYLRQFPTGDWKEPAHYWMGNACLSLAQSRPDKSVYLDSGAAWFQRLLDRSKPEDYYFPLALEGLAKAKAAKGDREGALEAARTALEKAPEEERSPLLLLAAQLRQGVDRNEEKSLMNRLLLRYPQSPEARYLRKLNGGADTARWKSGPGLPRPTLPAVKDSLDLQALQDAPAGGGKSRDGGAKPGETSRLPPAGEAEKGFTLQLGAFSQAANAQAMMAGLAKHGMAAELIETNRGGKPMYQVRLGRFASAEAASEYARLNLKPYKFLSQPVPLRP